VETELRFQLRRTNIILDILDINVKGRVDKNSQFFIFYINFYFMGACVSLPLNPPIPAGLNPQLGDYYNLEDSFS
jgi:hypothetical protein